MTVIAADVGGSKTLLDGFSNRTDSHHPQQFDNHAHPDFDTVLAQFLAHNPTLDPTQALLVLAIAGPVVDRQYCQMTNLPWIIDARALQQRFGFARVVLLNDLEATAFAMPGAPMAPFLRSLNGKPLNFDKRVAVMSIGTGLGEALLLPDQGQGRVVLSSEGGHKSFAPFDEAGARLLSRYLSHSPLPPSWEEWFSGSGLPHLFQALFPDDPPLGSADITRLAANPASHSARCIEFFSRGLIAEAGNIALQYWSEGGVIISGGVAQHIQQWLGKPALLQQFSQKTQYRPWLQQVPIALCSNTDAALLGAAEFGWQHHPLAGT